MGSLSIRCYGKDGKCLVSRPKHIVLMSCTGLFLGRLLASRACLRFARRFQRNRSISRFAISCLLLPSGLPSCLALVSGLLQFSVAFPEDLLFSAFEFILRRNIAYGAVQSLVIVTLNVLPYHASCVFQGQGRTRADTFAFKRSVPALNLAVALRVIGRSAHMGHTADSDKRLEVLGDKLRPSALNTRRALEGLTDTMSASIITKVRRR